MTVADPRVGSMCQEKLGSGSAELPCKRWIDPSIMGENGRFPNLRRSASTAVGKEARNVSDVIPSNKATCNPLPITLRGW